MNLLNEFLKKLLGEARTVRKAGDVWQTPSKKWSAKRADRTQGGFGSEEAARQWLAGTGAAPGEKARDASAAAGSVTTSTPGAGGLSAGEKPPTSTVPADTTRPKPSDREPTDTVTVPAPQGVDNLNTNSLVQQIRSGFVSPGNEFSRYSESVSIVTAKYVIDHPTASDEDVMAQIVKMDCGSKTMNSEVGVQSIPKKLRARYKALQESGVFKTCTDENGNVVELSESQNRARFMTMIVAQKKAERMRKAIQRRNLPAVSVDSFSGDQTSRQQLRARIESLPESAKIYSETGEELDRSEVLKQIGGFGTSRFPADTAMLGQDASGNVIFIGFSDKKDLKAIINNSSISVETERARNTLQELLQQGKVTQEQHDDAVRVLEEGQQEFDSCQDELQDVVVAPARSLVRVLRSGDKKQIYKLIRTAKTASGGSDPAKYWKRVSAFQSAAGKKPTPAREKEYLRWLRKAGWDGKSKVSDEVAMRAWALKSAHILENPETEGDLPKADQELLYRLQDEKTRKKTVERVGAIKRRAIDALAATRERLDEIKIGGDNGIGFGTFMDGVHAWQALHLNMGEFKGSLVMVAEDNVVDYEAIEDCLGGISERSDFLRQLKIDVRDVTSREHGIVTGTSVEVYSVGKEGQPVSVGVRSMRSKDGILGKLQTTWTFHPDFRDCLESKQDNEDKGK